ncbi:hypothetical protein SAMN05421823_112194 [Catalinimonas alkaloidigena]|uniref:Uncharacterized protein n=1 Tax=Catalinimonas alkaloidigena TaxID=1075417 RepID=A0A1G9SK62_9BACT|nr:hypothetical protein [Catalinimonas alkaloidigena]SDM35878.1 hypothetical protein SAMN05421823_112194 [Catalinimonas alkaloidigena]
MTTYSLRTLKHRFYERSVRRQRQFQVTLGCLAVAVNLMLGGMLFWLGISFIPLVFVSLALTLSVVAPFFDVPALVRKGQLTYQSTLFLSETPRRGVVVVHGGTLFDYYFVLDRRQTGAQRTQVVLAEYLKGLLQLAVTHPDDTRLRGTSYVLNERTARKVGLKRVNTDPIQYLILMYNFCNLWVSNYLVKGKWVLPKLSAIHTYEGTVRDIADRRAYIAALLEQLTSP